MVWAKLGGFTAPGRRGACMSILGEFTEALTDGRIDVVDLTAPLSADTPVI